jgi:hypothetical protein
MTSLLWCTICWTWSIRTKPVRSQSPCNKAIGTSWWASICMQIIFCKLMKNKTKGEMITAYQTMVDMMKPSALGLKDHRLDNECSEKFKECITKNEMTHELVPLDCHCWNIAKWGSRRSKTILSPSSAELTIDFPSSCGAILCDQQNSLSIYYDRAMPHQKCPCMPMSMGSRTT